MFVESRNKIIFGRLGKNKAIAIFRTSALVSSVRRASERNNFFKIYHQLAKFKFSKIEVGLLRLLQHLKIF